MNLILKYVRGFVTAEIENIPPPYIMKEKNIFFDKRNKKYISI